MQKRDEIEALISSRELAVGRRSTLLRRRADRQKYFQDFLGYFTIVVSAVLGGSIGTTLVTDVGWLSDPLWRVLGAVLGVLSAIAAGVQTRGNFTDNALKNGHLATEYRSLQRTIQRYRALYEGQKNEGDVSTNIDPPYTFLDWVDGRVDALEKDELDDNSNAPAGA